MDQVDKLGAWEESIVAELEELETLASSENQIERLGAVVSTLEQIVNGNSTR